MRVNASCTAVLLHISSGKYAGMVKAIDDVVRIASPAPDLFCSSQRPSVTDSDAVYKCCRSEETCVIKCNNNNSCLQVQTFH